MSFFLFSICLSCLCSSQLSLCEDDRLRMKLEFQKCLSVMDRCLVLPHAVSRTKLHTALAARRKAEQMVNTYSHNIVVLMFSAPPCAGLENM